MLTSTVRLFRNALLLRHGGILLLGILVTIQTNSVPGQVEESVHALQGATTGLRHREPDPGTTEDGHSGEAPESTHGGDATVGGVQQHVGHGARVAVLVGKVKSHGPRGSEGTDS